MSKINYIYGSVDWNYRVIRFLTLKFVNYETDILLFHSGIE